MSCFAIVAVDFELLKRVFIFASIELMKTVSSTSGLYGAGTTGAQHMITVDIPGCVQLHICG